MIGFNEAAASQRRGMDTKADFPGPIGLASMRPRRRNAAESEDAKVSGIAFVVASMRPRRRNAAESLTSTLSEELESEASMRPRRRNAAECRNCSSDGDTIYSLQ